MVTPADLRHLPLFRALSDAQLATLLGALVPRKLTAGEVLFRSGQVALTFQLLASGELELVDEGEGGSTSEKVVLRPFAPIGELGALTGLPRNATATALVESVVLEAPTDRLFELFGASSDLGFAFYKSFLDVVGDKVRRDKVRIDEMRTNLIRTQRAMKELRETVLSAEETALSQPVCDRLDDLIEHNRRTHYRVSPVSSHPATAKVGAEEHVILELSEGFLKLGGTLQASAGAELTVILGLPRGPVPVSGKVERAGEDGVLVRLDQLIDDYQSTLSAYMTELQMLDFVV